MIDCVPRLLAHQRKVKILTKVCAVVDVYVFCIGTIPSSADKTGL